MGNTDRLFVFVFIFFLSTEHFYCAQVIDYHKISYIDENVDVEQDSFFGISSANLGDLDGDGIQDIAVCTSGGGNGFDFTGGAIWILFLNSDGTVKSHQKIDEEEGGFLGTLKGDFFGISISNLGDIDGDNVQDIAVGHLLDLTDPDLITGALWVLFLNSDGTVKSHQKIDSVEGGFDGNLDHFDFFGCSIANLGDLDGDGIQDIAVGARGDDDGGEGNGAIWVLFLNSDGTVKSYQKISSTQGGFSGELNETAFFGYSIANLGDLDGDGIQDIAVGDPVDGENSGFFDTFGAIWILFLNGNGTVKAHQKINHENGFFNGEIDDEDFFGSSVLNLGDLDGDGIQDIAVGAINDDDGGLDKGAIWILFLNSNGTVKAHQKISNTQGDFDSIIDNEDSIGRSLAILEDFDGNGIKDIVVGATGDDDGGLDTGAVYLILLDENENFPVLDLDGDDFISTGREGHGSFNPSFSSYMVKNTGGLTLNYDVQILPNVDWLTIVPPVFFPLGPNESQEIKVFVEPTAASQLIEGVHVSSVYFSNENNGEGDSVVLVELNVVDESASCADLNNDGNVDVGDLITLQNMILGIEN